MRSAPRKRRTSKRSSRLSAKSPNAITPRRLARPSPSRSRRPLVRPGASPSGWNHVPLARSLGIGRGGDPALAEADMRDEAALRVPIDPRAIEPRRLGERAQVAVERSAELARVDRDAIAEQEVGGAPREGPILVAVRRLA